jgi:lambda family phage portal protein
MQQLALKSWLMSGDVFALIKKQEVTPLNPYSLRLHLVEADRVSTPSDCLGYGGVRPLFTTGVNPANNNKVYDGVEVDNGGKIVAYHVSNHYPNEWLVEPMKWVRVTAYGAKTGLPNILHIMDTERCEQYRGVTYLAPVIEMLLQLRQYTESELTAALIQTFFVAFIITETNPTGIPANEVGAGDYDGLPAEEAENISHSENEYEMGPGEVMHLKPGEKVEFGNPNVPTVGFDTFVKAISRLIGAGLEIPYEVLTKEFTKSYSASRGALLEAWEAFKMRRAWFIDDFCQPTYELWLAEAIARGRINAPGFFDDPRIRAAWCGAQWIGPTQGQLDPLKEAKAATLLVDRGFKTHEQITREMGGGDWDNNVDALKIENEKLRAAGAATVTMVEVEKEESEETGREE